MFRKYKWYESNPVSLILNLLWVYICYEICRLAFLYENWGIYASNLSAQSFIRISLGGFRFDTSAIFYTNAPFILLFLLPFHRKERKSWHCVTKWLYVVVNSICILMNLGDSVFFEFRKRRSTLALLDEFGGDNNITSIIGTELLSHWYLILLAVLMILLLWKGYRFPLIPTLPRRRYYLTQIISLVVILPLAIFGMRGNTFFSATRPISANYANKYVDNPIETGIVLNTPFCIIRSVNNTIQPVPVYFTDAAELDAIYTPLHLPSDSLIKREKNVVIFIVESFAQEFIGALNKDLDNGSYRGYTPFVDSLLTQSVYFENTFANTDFSIDAPPAILSSIPRMDRPFVLVPHSTNRISSLPGELRKIGYKTSFFHGADNESLGFNAFVKQAGVEEYYGKNEFLADSRFGGKAEFDGTWGIWDEPFLQFFCAKLSEMPQPFIATLFTLSSHHPFNIPAKYKEKFPDEGIYPLHKCIRYTDYSLGRFFEEAKKQKWYNNTIFIITADHASSKRTHNEYKNIVGDYRVPIIIFDPSGELTPGRRKGIMQHIDIMPTILNYLGYDRPYIAFGEDVFSTPADRTWSFSWNIRPQIMTTDYVTQLEDDTITAIYNYNDDPLLKSDISRKISPEVRNDMERKMKAFIQSYMQRMASDSVSVR